MQFNCVKTTCSKTWNELSGTARVSHHVCQVFCQFCVSSYAFDSVQVTIFTLQWTQGSPLFYSFWKFECLEMKPSWCRQVKWGNCGIPWVSCAVLCVKDDWKGQFWGLRYYPQNCADYSVFPSGMTLHSKIAPFNWECIAPLIEDLWHLTHKNLIWHRVFAISSQRWSKVLLATNLTLWPWNWTFK